MTRTTLATPILLAALTLVLCAPEALAGWPPVRATGGMVAADNARASAAGAAILEQGGNAIDAAVTTALVLGVVHPFASGIGGGGFAVVRTAKGEVTVLDFREVAPAGASRDMYLDESGAVIKGASTRGPRAAGVPGEVAGLYALHQKYGKLPWKALVQPAVALARDGFPTSELLNKRVKSRLEQIKARPALASLFLTAEGQPLPIGHMHRRPALAKTLSAIAERGPDGFYKGPVAEAIAAAMAKDAGLITAADLAAYAVKTRPAVVAEVMGFQVISMPPPSSGGAVLVQVIRALEGIDLAALGHNSSAYLHRLTEALKHGFADRARVMGDPDFTPVPVDQIIDDARIAEIKAAFKPESTLTRGEYGGQYGVPEDGGTTHFSVLDAAGNAVALTSTINTSFGSMYVAGESGVLMNNEMDDFVAKPGAPNAFGLIGREANAIEPGKRPLSSMSPTIVVKDGEARLVVGGSGGPTIITATVQVLLNVMVFGMDVRAAVEAPRVHAQWVPELLFASPAIAADVLDGLRRRGHRLKVMPRFGAVQAVMRTEQGQAGASDPSKLGRPAGVGEIGAGGR